MIRAVQNWNWVSFSWDGLWEKELLTCHWLFSLSLRFSELVGDSVLMVPRLSECQLYTLSNVSQTQYLLCGSPLDCDASGGKASATGLKCALCFPQAMLPTWPTEEADRGAIFPHAGYSFWHVSSHWTLWAAAAVHSLTRRQEWALRAWEATSSRPEELM